MAASRGSVKYWLVVGSALTLLSAVMFGVRALAPARTGESPPTDAVGVPVDAAIAEISAAEAVAMLGTDEAQKKMLAPDLDSAGLLVFFDAEGNAIPGDVQGIPGSEPPPVTRGPVAIWAGDSPAGGIGMDATGFRAYTFATVGRDGAIEVDCVTGTIGNVNEALAKARRGEE